MTCRQLLTTGLILLAASAQAEWQQWEHLVKAASQTGLEYYQKRFPDAEVIVFVDAPDSRLKLAQCDNNLTYSLGSPPENGGSLSIQVKCQGEQAWSMYLKSTVEVWANVLVTGHALKRGTLLTEADLEQQRINLAETRNGTLYDSKEAIGMELRRSLAAASPLRIRDLIEPMVVKRGDSVQIAAHAAGLRVLMSGTALANGRVGEQITISNNGSERKIRAKVIAEGLVEVPF